MENSVGARLRAARTLVPRLSARELSRLAGRPETQCALIEDRGQKTVQPEVLRPIAQALGVSMAWLAFGEGPDPLAQDVAAAIEAARARFEAAKNGPTVDRSSEFAQDPADQDGAT